MNSIRARLTAAMAILILLAVSILGAMGYWNARRTIIQETESGLTALPKDNTEILGMWFAERPLFQARDGRIDLEHHVFSRRGRSVVLCQPIFYSR